MTGQEIVMVAHLVNGTEVRSMPSSVSAAQVEQFKKFAADMMSSSDGWQLNLETEDGWAVFPKASVLYISMHPADQSSEEALVLLHEAASSDA